MPASQAHRRSRTIAAILAALASLLTISVLVAVLESVVGVPRASAAYLLAVVAVAVAYGTRAAIATAVGAFLAYDLLFVEPRYTLTVGDPGEWLNLVLLLVVGIVVGQLAGLQQARADAAETREREARALFQIGRALTASTTLAEAAAQVARLLRDEAGMARVWIRLEDESGISGRVLGDTSSGTSMPETAGQVILGRRPGDVPAVWTRIRIPSPPGRGGVASAGTIAYRVHIGTADGNLGSVWGLRSRAEGDPDKSQTRLISTAADQLAVSITRDHLAARATEAEVARRSEAVKTALLDSVSHDLRTPLASIRAAAGSLMDPLVEWDVGAARQTAAAIDREADRLNRLVSNLLDMSRIEAGGLKPRLLPEVLADVVETIVTRLTPLLTPRTIEVTIPHDLPPVLVDDVLFDQVLTNLLENAGRYTPTTAHVTLQAAKVEDHVVLTVADDGPGVPAASLPHLFAKFYRVPRQGEGSRRGTGIGLAVVRGLMEAMGGSIGARAGPVGGLAFDLSLVAAPAPSESM